MEDWNGIEGHTDRRQEGLMSLDGSPLAGWSQGRYSRRPVRERKLQYSTLDSRGSHCTVLGTVESATG